MRILLLQDALHLPSYGGGNKASRLLLEGLAGLGADCAMVGNARNQTIPPASIPEVERELAGRGITPWQFDDGQVFSYRYRGVEVDALDHPRREDRIAFVRRRIVAFQPDWIVVSDDRRHDLLALALDADARRTLAVVHTGFHLPFGPLASRPDAAQTERLRQARAVLTVSRYARDLLSRHGGIEARVVRFPLFGSGPYSERSASKPGWVTMINPCPVKGLAIFLALLPRFPEVQFAAVPTWGAEPEVLAQLEGWPNLTLLPPVDDLGELLLKTRVLLVPSLVPETFGTVAIEAMLRGISVLAAEIGGLPEAKLGVPYLLPVRSVELCEGGFCVPEQDVEPWAAALAELLSNPTREAEVARASRAAALDFVAEATPERFADLLAELQSGS